MTTMGHGIIHFDTGKCVKMDNFFAFFMPKSVQPVLFFFIFAMNHKVIPSRDKNAENTFDITPECIT